FQLGEFLIGSFDREKVLEAIHFYRVALALRPQSIETRHELGWALEHDLKDHAAAAQVFREITALRPDDPHMLNHLGVALQSAGDIQEAAAVFRQSLRLDPQLSVSWMHLGAILKLLGD